MDNLLTGGSYILLIDKFPTAGFEPFVSTLAVPPTHVQDPWLNQPWLELVKDCSDRTLGFLRVSHMDRWSMYMYMSHIRYTILEHFFDMSWSQTASPDSTILYMQANPCMSINVDQSTMIPQTLTQSPSKILASKEASAAQPWDSFACY